MSGDLKQVTWEIFVVLAYFALGYAVRFYQSRRSTRRWLKGNLGRHLQDRIDAIELGKTASPPAIEPKAGKPRREASPRIRYHHAIKDAIVPPPN